MLKKVTLVVLVLLTVFTMGYVPGYYQGRTDGYVKGREVGQNEGFIKGWRYAKEVSQAPDPRRSVSIRTPDGKLKILPAPWTTFDGTEQLSTCSPPVAVMTPFRVPVMYGSGLWQTRDYPVPSTIPAILYWVRTKAEVRLLLEKK